MVGRVIELLEARGLMDNTLIAFVSDHGEMAGDYNLMGKGNFYEEGIRVPLIVVPPGGASSSRVPALVETSDLAPTILDYAGVEIPPQMPTRSLRSLLEGGAGGRESVLCEFMTNDRSQKTKCIRTERYKYVFAGSDGQHEFYDLREDPDELRDLYHDPACGAEVSRHKDLLLDRLMHGEQYYYHDETPSARDLKVWLS